MRSQAPNAYSPAAGRGSNMIQAGLRALLQAAGEPAAQPPPAEQVPASAAVTVGTGQAGQSIPSTGAVVAGKCTPCVLCMQR